MLPVRLKEANFPPKAGERGRFLGSGPTCIGMEHPSARGGPTQGPRQARTVHRSDKRSVHSVKGTTLIAPQSPHDQNLLFGVLALQLDFVDQQQLIDAMQDWLRYKQKSLGQLLVERHVLSTERRQLLETLVQEHVRQHEDDPQKSLAAVPVPATFCDLLRSLGDQDVARSVAHCSRAPGAASPAAAPEFTMPHVAVAKRTAERRFEVLRPLAEGGLGVVSVANDTELTREVALKEIKPMFADHVNSRARFMQEAEITGRLEHPGVVPVYGLGTYPDGRPYYAMRMIKGKSLQEAIAEFHDESASHRSAGERSLAMREMLQRFIDVCNAIEYAHSRGIVHRDLKPANIMLGKYRETLVVDWGLAKSVGGSRAVGPLGGNRDRARIRNGVDTHTDRRSGGDGGFHESRAGGGAFARRGSGQ